MDDARPRGRPRKDPAALARWTPPEGWTRLVAWVSPDEKKALKRIAVEADVSMADLVRSLAGGLAAQVITAEELHRLGAIDVLVETGCGEAAVRDLIAQKRRRHNGHVAFYRARRRVQAVTHAELQDVVDIWVDAALRLTEADLRKMERLVAAQDRRSRPQPGALEATA